MSCRWILLAVAVIVASANLSPARFSAAEIDTVAGTGSPTNNGDRGQAKEVNIGDPFGVEVGPDGGLYVTEVRNHRVWRIDLKTDEARVVAGMGEKGYAGDGGPATKAKLNEPYEVRFDRAGNMLFVEMQNHLVRKVDAKTGVISTIAGTGEAGFSGDGGPATKATFRQPHSIALDAADNVYIADILNHRIRRVDAKSGIVTTLAGNGEKKLPRDGAEARDKPLFGPRALYVEHAKNILWIALREGHSVWQMDLATTRMTHVAGTGQKGYSGDGGPAKEATFDGPKGLALAPDGSVWVVDTENQTLRRIDLITGTISTTAGGGPKQKGGRGDGGPATAAQLDRPHGIGIGPDGTVYTGDTLNHRVRRVK
jgi:sugar lactone lactonase YvrE